MDCCAVQKQRDSSHLQHRAEMAKLEGVGGRDCCRRDVGLSAAAVVFLKLTQSGNLKVL